MPPGTRRRSCSTARSTDGGGSATAPSGVAVEPLETRTAAVPGVLGPTGRARQRSGGRAGRHRPGSRPTRRRGRRRHRGVHQDRAVAQHLRAASPPASPPPAHRPASPAAVGSRTPRTATGRPSTAAPRMSAARSRCSSQPVRTIRPRAGDDAMAAASSSSPQPGGPASTRATSACRWATAPNARTSPGRSLRGSAVPTARQRRAVPAGRHAAEGGLGVRSATGGSSGTPGLTTRTRAGSAAKASITSCATKAESVWTQAPRCERPADQPRIGQRGGIAQLGVVQRREVVHRDDGGGTQRRRHDEVGAVDDVDRADEPLDRGRSARAQSACSGRAGMARWWAATPAGRRPASNRRRRQLTA